MRSTKSHRSIKWLPCKPLTDTPYSCRCYITSQANFCLLEGLPEGRCGSRGRPAVCFFRDPFPIILPTLHYSLSALESTLKAHLGAGTTGAFSGKGQTLGGSSTPQRDIATSASTAAAGLTNLDPQVKLFMGLIGAYLLFWYLTS